MIHISRPRLRFNLAEHPLVRYEQQRATAYFASTNRRQRQPFSFRSCREIPGFMETLGDAFANKCVYCERALPDKSDREIGLIRPNQVQQQGKELLAQDHYWWLNWEWSNLVVTCHPCNWNKGAWFPVAGRRLNAGERGISLQNEKALLLDPCLDFPDDHLIFLEDGEVVPVEGSIEGQTTIAILQLNRAELVHGRRAEADRLKRVIELTHPRDYARLSEIESGDHKPFSGLRKQILARRLSGRNLSPMQQNQAAFLGKPARPRRDVTVIKSKPASVNVSISSDADLIDRTLENRWRVERLIGEGGMGKVYLARDMRLSMRKVVVKIPDIQLLRHQAVRSLFEREVDILIEHQHPGIVKVEDRGDVDGLPFVVLQYLAAGNLKSFKQNRKGRMAVQDVFQWLFPVARALDFLHGADTLHRDVKPGNILFDKTGHAFLADFGIAKVLGNEDAQPVQSLSFSGTVKYMAPEKELTPAYDQYALALVVVETLTGQVIDLNIRSQRLGRHAFSSLPENAQDVLVQALDPVPGSRYASCIAFAHAFKKAVTV